MAEKNMPAMPWFVKDYLIDTMHLTTEQHGAYMLLLGNAWIQGGSLPDNDKQMASIARLSLEAWLEMKPTVMEFWTLKSGRWMQKRLSKELAYVTGKRDARRAAGQKGGRASHWKTKENVSSNAKAKDVANPEQTPSKEGSNAQAPTLTLTLTQEREERTLTTTYQTLPPEPELADEPEPGGGFFEENELADEPGLGDDPIPAKPPREPWAVLGDEIVEMAGLADRPRPVTTGIVRQWLADWPEADIRAAVSDAVERETYDAALVGGLKYFEKAIRRRVETRQAEHDTAAATFWADFPVAAAGQFVGKWRDGAFEWEPDKHGPAPDQPGFMGPADLKGPRQPPRRVHSNIASFVEAAARGGR